MHFNLFVDPNLVGDEIGSIWITLRPLVSQSHRHAGYDHPYPQYLLYYTFHKTLSSRFGSLELQCTLVLIVISYVFQRNVGSR